MLPPQYERSLGGGLAMAVYEVGGPEFVGRLNINAINLENAKSGQRFI